MDETVDIKTEPEFITADNIGNYVENEGTMFIKDETKDKAIKETTMRVCELPVVYSFTKDSNWTVGRDICDKEVPNSDVLAAMKNRLTKKLHLNQDTTVKDRLSTGCEPSEHDVFTKDSNWVVDRDIHIKEEPESDVIETMKESCVPWTKVEIKLENETEITALTSTEDKVELPQSEKEPYSHIPVSNTQIYSCGKVIKRNTCDECGKSFTTAWYLKVHQRVHKGEKPYTCNECGESFTRAYHLGLHRRTHKGVKTFTCDECGKSFAEAWDLTAHRRIYKDVKPHTCEECGKTFTPACYLPPHHCMFSMPKTTNKIL